MMCVPSCLHLRSNCERRSLRMYVALWFVCAFVFGFQGLSIANEESSPSPTSEAHGLFSRENLVAWCIVPFDARKRGPEARAEMMRRLGFTRFAYDWREEHIAEFDEEMETLKRWGIKLEAFWFPGGLNREAQIILDLLKRHELKAQLWVTMDFGPIETNGPDDHEDRVRRATEAICPILSEAEKIGCVVGLYNHGGWFGEPENQIAIIERLDSPNVGIVYNLHHGHHHVDRFESMLQKMKPHLLCLNLNGTARDGDQIGKKILPLGQGELDLQLLKIIAASGYDGPIGILGHTMDDAETTLRDNLDGLDWLLPQLSGAAPPGPPPKPRNGAFSIEDRWQVEGAAIRASLPEGYVIPAARDDELTPASEPPPLPDRDWPRSHGNAASARYSALHQIDKTNIAKLGVAWIYRSGDGASNVQCNPVIVNGVIYAPTAGERIVAIDGATGRELWDFKPDGRPAHRGLTYWPGTATTSARLLFHAGDDLWALAPKTGSPVETFGKGGRVRSGAATVAPVVFENIIVTAGLAGDAFAFDAATGAPLWTFHTIPRPGEPNAETWNEAAQGANCWGGISLDERRGIVYLATGSPKPNFTGAGHWGTNLYSNCVIALDARTGKRLWHFQEIRHDIWDLDLPAPPVLVTVERNGRLVDAVAQVTKIGNTLLLDRVTGKPLFPVPMRRAPASRLPGERTWPYQPAIELPEPFARQMYEKTDLTNRSEDAREFVAARVANANAGWFEPFDEGRPTVFYGIHGGAEWTGAAFDPRTRRLYVTANELPWIVSVFTPDETPRDPNAPPTRGESVYQTNCAQCHGADRVGVGMAPPLQSLARRMDDARVLELLENGSGSMPVADAIAPDDRAALLDFLFLRDRPKPTEPPPRPRVPNYTSNGYPKLLDHEGFPGCKPPWGTLNCLDLDTGKLLWKVPLGEYPELAEQGLKNTGAENFGGAIATAGGLVFAAGTPDRKLRAFDSETGEELWSGELPFGGYAPPATYEANGRQFIVIAATGGGKLGGEMGDTWVAFAVGGRTE